MLLTTQPAAGPMKKDTLGCTSSQLRTNLEMRGTDMAFYRKCMDNGTVHRVAMPASDRGYLIGVSMNSGHRRDIFHGQRKIARHFSDDSIYIRDMSDDYRADLHGNFDFVLIELPGLFFDRLDAERDAGRFAGLTCSIDQRDPVLGHLARAVAGCFDTTGALNALFVEQMGLAIGIHLSKQYGTPLLPASRIGGMLSRAQEALAKELLIANLNEGMAIADVARECNLSRGYFIRAFAKTTGRTPHQWLLDQRIQKARKLVEASEMTLTEIATCCGFADQSHLNRTFTRVVGKPPGAWRRRSGR
ncbi:AraC family transcriptional regulator [Burkholderia sp. Bp9031]|uniref:AraC family transcriptional regulator n=1 Tax=Burkholderia sp. Bp9031 TaxID=2184566 RepID=UPI000F5ECA93|nr:AraC family transcriptional regulator [Burkholderia sp. Bp9031]RQZ18842.1 AraC family transcriptional regulator [Burkholderia sp. Bp9031]